MKRSPPVKDRRQPAGIEVTPPLEINLGGGGGGGAVGGLWN